MSEVDFERGMILLPDSKTGRKPIYLSAAALAVLADIPRQSDTPYLIPGHKPGVPRADLNKPWAAFTRAAGLIGVRIHDLRHTFASFGAGASMGLPIIGKCLDTHKLRRRIVTRILTSTRCGAPPIRLAHRSRQPCEAFPARPRRSNLERRLEFNWSEFRTPRLELSTRLDLLERSLATAAQILSSIGHLRAKQDADLLSLIVGVSSPALGVAYEPIENELLECDRAISAALVKVRIARKEFDALGGSGKPPLLWYEPIVEGAIHLAKHLGIQLTTGGDRSVNPYGTKFTCLAMGLEGFLPDEMRSDNLAACAKRIERSAVWKRHRCGSNHQAGRTPHA